MNVETIRRRLGKQGPFLVRTSDGEGYTVLHPEFVWVGRYNVVIEDKKGGIDIIDPLHIVSISRTAGVKRRNGAQK